MASLQGHWPRQINSIFHSLAEQLKMFGEAFTNNVHSVSHVSLQMTSHHSVQRLAAEWCFIICPMHQQHWTDYKISLCVCQSVSQWVSQSVNFGTPFISRERLKLETSNLANRLATGGTNEKMQNQVKRGHVTDF